MSCLIRSLVFSGNIESGFIPRKVTLMGLSALIEISFAALRAARRISCEKEVSCRTNDTSLGASGSES